MNQIGQAKKRVTGKLKTTGGAKYAAEFAIANVAHGFLTTSTIAKGRIINIDTKEAQALPGVIAIITHQNAPQLPFEPVPETAWVNPGEIGQYPHTLHTDRIYFYAQPVAIAIAETLEQAELAASLIGVQYQEESANVNIERVIESQLVSFPDRPDRTRGNPEAAFSNAEVSIDANYVVPVEHHNPIEPHATIAFWSGNKLTVYDKTQWVSSVRQQLSSAFGISKGAERIGWTGRNPQPRSMSENGLLIGYGMASATYPMNWRESVARVKILQDGTAIVQSAASDMGPGTYTAMTEIASEFLGIPGDRIFFELGNTNFPNAAVHGGSTTVTSVGSAVKAACEQARTQALTLAQNTLFAATKSSDIKAQDERIFDRQNPTKSLSYREILSQANQESIEAEATAKPKEESPYSMHSFGATFVEVKIDEWLGKIDVTSVVSAVDVGRIINPKTATSQIIGGVVGGIGMALLEDTYQDPRYGNYVNANLGEYLVPVNADIGDIEAIFCGEPDYNANPLGARGIGEIAIVGIAPAIANAVYHATGKRIRQAPITLDKLL